MEVKRKLPGVIRREPQSVRIVKEVRSALYFSEYLQRKELDATHVKVIAHMIGTGFFSPLYVDIIPDVLLEKCLSETLYLKDLKYIVDPRVKWEAKTMLGNKAISLSMGPIGAAVMPSSIFGNLSVGTEEGLQKLSGNGIYSVDDIYKKYDGYPLVVIKADDSDTYVAKFNGVGMQIFRVLFPLPMCVGEVVGDKIYFNDFPEIGKAATVKIGKEVYRLRQSKRVSVSEIALLQQTSKSDGLIFQIRGREYKMKFERTYDVLREDGIYEVADLSNDDKGKFRPDKMTPDSVEKIQRISKMPIIEDFVRLVWTKNNFSRVIPSIMPSHGLVKLFGASTRDEYATICNDIFLVEPTQDMVVEFDTFCEKNHKDGDNVEIFDYIKQNYFCFTSFTNRLKKVGIPFTWYGVARELVEIGAVRVEGDQMYITDPHNLTKFDYSRIVYFVDKKIQPRIIVHPGIDFSALSRISELMCERKSLEEMQVLSGSFLIEKTLPVKGESDLIFFQRWKDKTYPPTVVLEGEENSVRFVYANNTLLIPTDPIPLDLTKRVKAIFLAGDKRIGVSVGYYLKAFKSVQKFHETPNFLCLYTQLKGPQVGNDETLETIQSALKQ